MQKRLLLFMALLLTCSLAVMAQVTTSSMSGKVVMQGSDEEVIGATVQAVHEPSGTRYQAVTNVEDRFNIQGMRTGHTFKMTTAGSCR